MKLGDKIKKRVYWTEIDRSRIRLSKGCVQKHEIAEGTVVYIHPKGRFYTLEFNLPTGSFRESFKC